MKLSVLIPTYKRPEKLKKCLDAMSGQLQMPDEIILVHRKDDHETITLLGSYKNKVPLVPLTVDQPGVIHAENTAIQFASGDLLCFIDDDGYAPPDWCFRIKRTFQENENIIALGGPDNIIGDEHFRKHKTIFGKITWYGQLIGNHHHRGTGIHTVQVLKGVNMAIRRDIMPLLDPNLNSERYQGNGCHWELDVFLTIKKSHPLGLIVFDTSLEVQHESNHRNIDIEANHRNNARNMTYVYFKHFSTIKLITHLFYLLFIGHERIPGLAKTLHMLLKKDPHIWIKVKAAWQGVTQGLSLYLKGSP